MKHLLSTFSSLITRRRSRPERWCMAFIFAAGTLLLLNAYGDQLGELSQSLFGSVQDAYAQSAGTTPSPSSAGDSNSASNAVGAVGRSVGTVISGLATLFIKLIGGILYFVLKWMGPLMDNTFILEGDIGEKLRSVWVIVRNFVNIFFALALVIVALMSVVGYGDEGGNYALKKFIPKMALALIAVNFTFLACRIVLDINNVLTTAIFSIPQSVTTVGDIGPSGTAGQTIFKKFKCFDDTPGVSANKQVENAKKLEDKYGGTITSLGGVCFAQDPTKLPGQTGECKSDAQLRSKACADKDTQQAIISLDQSQFTKKDFVWVMATQFQGIHDLNKVSVLLDPTFSGLTVNALFSVVFSVIYATAYISMFIILIARMAVLWVTIMLSPLVAISIVFPDLKFDDFDIKERFLTHAFVPAKMALPLALGYIMLSQMTLAVDGSSGIFKDATIDIASGGDFARGVSFTTLIYGAASVAVLWMGVFSATKGVVGEGVVTTFSDSIKSIGQTVAKWPTYIPLSPVSNGMTLSSLKYTGSQLGSRLAELQRQKNQKFADDVLGDYFPSNQIATAIRNITAAAKNGNIDKTSLGTLASGASSVRLGDTLKDTLKNLKDHPEKRAELARMAGYGSNVTGFEDDVNSGRNLETIQTELKKNSSSPSSSNRAVNYGSVAQGLTRVTAASSLGKAASVESTIGSKEIRDGLGLKKDASGEYTIDYSATTPEAFMNSVKSRNLSTSGFQQIVNSNALTNIANQREEIRGMMVQDEPFLNRFSRAIDESSTTSVNNKALRTTFEAVTKKSGNADLKLLGPAGKRIAGINKTTGKYTAPTGT
jgi:hypothetical protein